MHLLERDTQLRQLADAFSAAVTGNGSTWLLLGEAGIGKTSLARHLLDTIGNRGRCYSCLCDGLFTPRPLGPLHDLARSLRLEGGRSLSDFPDRSERFAAVAESLTGSGQPALLLVEDLQWADEATLDFIQYFARRIADKPFLLLLTARVDELGPQHPLRLMLGRMPAASVRRLPLPPLSQAAVTRLAADRGYDAATLWQASAGNPFFVSELLAAEGSGVPDTVRDALLATYARQPAPVQEAWQLLAAMPEGLEPDWLDALSAELQDAIHDSINRGILCTGARIQFRHELYRRTLAGELSPRAARLWATRVLELFAARFESTGALERLVHQARVAARPDLVLLHAPDAARRAAVLGAHADAARLWGAALEAATTAAKRLPLLEPAANEYFLTGRFAEGIPLQEEALAAWMAAEDSARSANAERLLSRLCWYGGRQSDAAHYAREAVERFATLPPSAPKALALSNRAQLCLLAGDLKGALRWGHKAIAMAGALGDRETLCHALNTVGSAQARLPASEAEGFERLAESLALARADGYDEQAGRAFANCVHHQLRLGELSEAEKLLTEGLHYCQHRDLLNWHRYLSGLQARLLLEMGRWTEAASLARELLEDEQQPPLGRFNPLLVAAAQALRTGQHDSESLLEEAKELAFSLGGHQRVVPLLLLALEHEWLTGTVTLTEPELAATLTLIAKVPNARLNAEAAWWLGRARPSDNRLLPHLDASLLPVQRAYEGALRALEVDTAPESALSRLDDLGALPALRRCRQQLKAKGATRLPRGKRAATRHNPAFLTARQMDILQLLPGGASNKEIAAALFVSAKTIEHHVSAILQKLDAGSRRAAVRRASEMGLLQNA